MEMTITHIVHIDWLVAGDRDHRFTLTQEQVHQLGYESILELARIAFFDDPKFDPLTGAIRWFMRPRKGEPPRKLLCDLEEGERKRKTPRIANGVTHYQIEGLSLRYESQRKELECMPEKLEGITLARLADGTLVAFLPGLRLVRSIRQRTAFDIQQRLKPREAMPSQRPDPKINYADYNNMTPDQKSYWLFKSLHGTKVGETHMDPRALAAKMGAIPRKD